MQAALLDENDVLVVISQTGASHPPINPSLELSKLADVVLLSVSHESRPETLASRVVQLALIQGLYVLTATRMSQIANQNEYLIWDAIMRASNPQEE